MQYAREHSRARVPTARQHNPLFFKLPAAAAEARDSENGCVENVDDDNDGSGFQLGGAAATTAVVALCRYYCEQNTHTHTQTFRRCWQVGVRISHSLRRRTRAARF